MSEQPLAGDQGGTDQIIPKDVMERLGKSNLARMNEYSPHPSAEELVHSDPPFEEFPEIASDEPPVYYVDDRKDRLDVTPELFAMLLPMLPEHQEGDFAVTVYADSFIALLEATGATVKRFEEWPTE